MAGETPTPEELSYEELDAQGAEQLPDREVMSVIRAEPMPELPYIPPGPEPTGPDDTVTIQPVDPATE